MDTDNQFTVTHVHPGQVWRRRSTGAEIIIWCAGQQGSERVAGTRVKYNWKRDNHVELTADQLHSKWVLVANPLNAADRERECWT